MNKTLIAAVLALAAGVAAAQSTPAGLWKTIDDATKAEKSLVRITDAGGVYTGKIEKILTDKTDAKCTLCTDERKDQPVQGMTIVRNVKAAAGDDNLWDGGEILDPAKQGSGDPFYTAKLHTARFYFAKLLPETAGLIRSARAGAAPLMAMDEAMF